MPAQEILPFLSGILFCFALWSILYSIKRQIPIVGTAIIKTVNTREFGQYMLNLVIAAIGISVTVDALVISAGGNNMTTDKLNQLVASAQFLIHMVYALVGGAIGAIVIT